MDTKRDIIKINPDKVNSKNYKLLKKLLIEVSNLIIKEKLPIESPNSIIKENSYIKNASELEDYSYLIWYCLTILTNIKYELKKNKLSKDEIIFDFLEIFNKLKKSEENQIIEDFMGEVNKTFLKSKKTDPKRLKIIFCTNIRNIEGNEKELEKILHFFNLKRFEVSELSFKDKKGPGEIKKLIPANELIGGECIGRSSNCILKTVEHRMYSFYGYLTFISKFRRNMKKFHINPYALDNSLTSLIISTYFITDMDNKLIEDSEKIFMTLSSKINPKKEEKIEFNESFERYYESFQEIFKSNKKNLIKKMQEYFELYYLASVESNIESSFFNYWALNEKILREMNGEMNGKQLLKTIKKLLKLYGVSIHQKNILNILYKKRNKLVHENKNYIEEEDRNLCKKITDTILQFYINFFNYPRNIKEYGFILENITNEIQTTKRNIELLDSVYKNKKFNEIAKILREISD